MVIKKILFGVQLWLGFSFVVMGQTVEILDTPTGIEFWVNSNPVLTYRTAKAEVPKGQKEAFALSGFIHPLQTLSGQVLTRIQPTDHYHHYGIWAPWTRATLEGRTIDFWNLGDEKGRVEFAGILKRKENQQRALVTVRQNHLDLTALGQNTLVLEEDLSIALEPLDSNRYLLDYQRNFWTKIPSGVTLDQYRYGGGIFIRAVEIWGSKNSQILTSEFKTRDQADGTRAKWMMVSGVSGHESGKSGILLLSHPNNHSHPEPLRVWPSDSNQGEGNVFVGFTPTREAEWKLGFGQRYSLNYRLIVFDGELSVEEAETFWLDFVKTTGIIDR
ncbi:PmoA family protein [Algoriphagus sp.]|uniref:DUF6807 domain-containing protein n=1 Tax=Algoriphagus sp. TaxID=1872435 RepID=UPI0026109FFC|nr:PmoA family protein [Algoriphagus sp.]